MEKISINNGKEQYEIISIRPIQSNVLQIIFSGSVPDSWGDITVYTLDGTVATTLFEYETVYRKEGHIVYLSNDGSVYSSPETPGAPGRPPEPYEPTLEELQAVKRREISADCEKIIYSGIDVQLQSGVEHFSLTEHDQLNLFGKQAQLAAGVTQLEYHADGQPCRYYRAEEMLSIIQAATFHVSYHTTYCNALNMWVAGMVDKENLCGVFYGVDVPEEYQSDVLKAYLIRIEGLAGDMDV